MSESVELEDVIAFLMGEGPLDGHWFGDTVPATRGAYWWRDALRKAWSRRTKPEGEPVAWREGYKLVPVEPTEAMLQAGAAAARDFMSERGPYPRTRAVFAAMLAAAPPAPAEYVLVPMTGNSAGQGLPAPQAPASPTKEEIARVVLAIVFERAQPNRGDVFSWLDDNIEPIADTILSLMSVETSNA